MSQWARDIDIFGEICVGLNLGKQKKIWNKGFDGMMVDTVTRAELECMECVTLTWERHMTLDMCNG